MFIIISGFYGNIALAQLKLPSLVSDNMVLQRDAKLPIWGYAKPGEKVTLTFQKQSKTGKAGTDGKWTVNLDPIPAGGPFSLTVSAGKEQKTINNILVGEVWLAGGQSNMQWQLEQTVNNYQAEIAAANYPQIRQFGVKQEADSKPHLLPDTSAKWKLCVPENAGKFSAVAYFYARAIHLKYNIPVGILYCNWGGTVAEAWTSSEALRSNLPEFADVLDKIKNYEANKTEIDKQEKEENEKRVALIRSMDKGAKPVNGKFWFEPGFDAKAWKTIKAPGAWESNGLEGVDGIIYLRYEVNLSAEQAADKNAFLSLGPIDDEDSTWVNGVKVGGMDLYSAFRKYSLPAGLLKEGKNTIVVKVTDTGGNGGFTGTPEQFFLKAGAGNVSLAGNWKYEAGMDVSQIPPRKASLFKGHNVASKLYNAMLYPLIPYAIKGAIWYQGESNATRAYQYRTLFKTLISDWRKQWNQGDFPFLYCQLANYMKADTIPTESAWAELREAQSMTLSVPNTAMACLIDIGDAKDIHPRNKQDVGWRLFLAAQKLVYKENVVASGPTYQSQTVEGNKIRLKFDNVGGGLKVKDKYGYVKGFAIAGPDYKWVYAQARLENNTVVVYSDKISNPVAVRYAWANNPEDNNLYNKEGLPAPPFRTDNQPGITKDAK